jgi:hypothetical protein
MNGTRGFRRATLVLALALMAAQTASAGPLLDALMDKLHGCPPSNYSPLHVLTPDLYYAHECLHGPRVSVYPPNRVPGVQPTFERYCYPCRSVVPSALVAEREALIARYTTGAAPEPAGAKDSQPETLSVYPKPEVDSGR